MIKATFVLLLAASASAAPERSKRQFFGGFGGFGGFAPYGLAATHTQIQPTVHTASVQQPIVTQEIQQPVYQTKVNAPIVQHHQHVIDTPVYKQVHDIVKVPTHVLDPVVVQPRIIVPKPSTTKISVIQRAKRQLIGGLGGYGAFGNYFGLPYPAAYATVAPAAIAAAPYQAAAPAAPASYATVAPAPIAAAPIQLATATVAPVATATIAAPVQLAPAPVPVNTVYIAPPLNIHHKIVNPPIIQRVIRPVVHTQSTVLRPVVHEVHSNVYVPEYIHVKPKIIEQPIVQLKPSTHKISVIQKRSADAASNASTHKISVIQKRQILLGGGLYGGIPYAAAPLTIPHAPRNTKISVIQRA